MKMQFFSWIFLMFFILSCKKEKTMEPTSCDTIPHTYSKDIKPIVLTNCAISGCHVQGGSGPGDFTQYAPLANYAQNGKLRDRVINKKDMPPPSSGKKLTQTELDKIDCWIRSGAPNN